MRKSKKNGEIKLSAHERALKALELPRDIILNMPKITVLGDREISIENYKGIVEYDTTLIRLNTTLGLLVIEGEMLDITTITDDDITISGKLLKLMFT